MNLISINEMAEDVLLNLQSINRLGKIARLDQTIANRPVNTGVDWLDAQDAAARRRDFDPSPFLHQSSPEGVLF